MKSLIDLNLEFYSDEELIQEKVSPKAYDKYIDAVDEILAENSRDIGALEFKQMLLFLKGKYKECLKISDNILNYTTSIQALITKSNCLLYLENYADCVATCREILAIEPKNKIALQNWEEAYEGSGFVFALKPPRSFLKHLYKSLELDVWFCILGLVLKVVICCAIFYILLFYFIDLVNNLLR